MKRIWQHPAEPTTGKRHWRSLGEYAKTPEFEEKLGREFDPALNHVGDEERESSRREFVKLMGGAAALAGLTLTSCRRPLQKVMPFTKHVEWVIPGKPLLYATAMPGAHDACPMVVVTHEGRPTHLQGNPLHPSGAGLNVFAQSSIVDLYNPDRAQRPADRGHEHTWAEYQSSLDEQIGDWKSSAGEGLALLLNPSTSPTRAGLLADFAKAYPKSKIYEYEPLHRDGCREAVKTLLGDGVSVLPRLAKADRVVALDCDFAGLDSPYEAAAKEFMSRRAPSKASDEMNRLYVVENRYTLTGGVSDHRLPLAASLIPVAAALLAQEVGKLTGNSALVDAAKTLAESADDKLRAWVVPAAKDLADNKGKSLVLAGSRYSAAVHALVLGINQALGSFGTTLETLKVEPKKTAGWADFAADLKGKKIKHVVVMTDTDPAYDGHEVFGIIKTMEEGPVVTHLTMRPNHTTHYSKWALPMAHYLETWDDVHSATGVYSVVQPMIQPLFLGVSVNELLLAFLGRKKFTNPVDDTVVTPPVTPAAAPAAGAAPAAAAAVAIPPATAAPAAAAEPEPDAAYVAVKDTFSKLAGGWNEEKWDVTLRDGFLAGSSHPKASASFNAGAIAGLVAKAPKPIAPNKKLMEVVLTPDSHVYDGRYVDNPWLQEAPDPITKITWDNAAWLNPTTFAELGLKEEGDLIFVEVDPTHQLKIAAIPAPGHARDSISISLGYGQDSFNIVGKDRGFNGYRLDDGTGKFVFSEVTVQKAGGNYELANTQESNLMEGRALAREGTKDRFDKNVDFAQKEGMDSHIPPNIPLYQGQVGVKSASNPSGFDYEGHHQWGMAIDLGKCIGCTACTVACQSENTIPIVGKDQVNRGRVMHWIRMDRYFATSGDITDRGQATLNELDNPEMLHQPLACQQCESAPCETVCPVNATVHTEEGINAMAYNRCIGTRYCNNNCPYTARRFNWFDYNKRNPLINTTVAGVEVRNLYAGPLGVENQDQTRRLQRNPNVTVRMRGVMEKCTYCIQRLEAAKITQRRVAGNDPAKLRIPADAVKTACQASCPTEAIMFGDIANVDATIVKWKASPRSYDVLKYIGTRPRTSYLARIRNVNPAMPDDRVVKTGEATLHGV